MIVAVVGCTHGELDLVYNTLNKLEKENNFKVNIVICCGDFQSIRYNIDNESLNVPNKYKKEVNDFTKYFSGEKKAKILTIFIGGNHEAMNVLKQLYYGGWVAPNIYYLGYSNVHNINGIRICSLSGIYKKYNFYKTYNECYPYNNASKVSAYHIRKYEIEKLKILKNKVDIIVTHDWPNNIEKHGNLNDLLKSKSYFKTEILTNTLGNPQTEILLNKLKPNFWFAAHLHVKYSSIYIHNDKINYTKFLSLDKAEPHRHFIQILNFEKIQNSLQLKMDHVPNTLKSAPQNLDPLSSDPEKETEKVEAEKGEPEKVEAEKEGTNDNVNSILEENQKLVGTSIDEKEKYYLCYDIEWLAIIKANHNLISINSDKNYNLEDLKYPTNEDFEFVKEKLKKLKQISINGKQYYPINGYNTPNYKNLIEQRKYFLNLLDLEELSIYNGYELNFFNEEFKKLN
ncbi:RNA lariat debranching enzyme, putative [Plasmodium berghei]|uniref:RNA lariat debranching enzyme, putative n=2 Tax=Plasmodium berghei TaxID=5821 RepID=A0A509AY45_PLABA|nr:RNA lariat debranching enzyme, putative [Plasmodium berghei ANKA]CXJ02645.1 RNA lariat debranching enzyme, putative [Plasmodium berghei]SCL98339.1 RNA lariat debranching enzyme, putative [Plasmodium berghei]SCM16813.1 RNA lariat debranching enzyme, putative [Plasmodium berghei]SCM18611.1 RNA lariat debranching enzyme, putative [Plasmodium berghei]SCN28046.1 RNA lariat debranching enzyme, putative [Plasmodium berghei]|eukprot:XP_034423697.1 RNA lariat debranching enzyme, putative [Plasmodium berghei ANKA]